MALLKRFLRIKDQYEQYPGSGWIQFQTNGPFTTETACGYKIHYGLTCHYTKVNHQEFKAARMLDESSKAKLLEIVNRDVVVPALRAKNRFLRFTAERYLYPALCCIVGDRDQQFVALDNSCIELNQDLNTTQFTQFGCSITFLDLKLHRNTDEMVEENYKRMIRLYDITSIKNTPEYANAEERVIIALAHRELELKREFLSSEPKVHSGNNVTIVTRAAGQAVDISWSFDKPLLQNETLRGYMKEGGFWTGSLPLENNGVCIVDSRSKNSSVQSLSAGKDYFFTFAIVGVYTDGVVVVESLRFSVRVPMEEELSRIDELTRAVTMPKKEDSPLGEKTARAMRELLSFVEFDENVSQLEKQLVDRISGKDYSPQEKSEKIERLKAVVESLRIENS
jgi:hypothetical protein